MYIEWDNPPPNADVTSMKAYIKDIHEKIISPGTGCTVAETTVVQYNVDTDVITITDGSHFTKPTAPLIYKYESVGNKTLYIKLVFYAGKYTDYAVPLVTTARIGIWDNLVDCEKGYVYSNITIDAMVRNRFYGSGGSLTINKPSGRSFISNNNGVLTIFGHVNYQDNTAYDYNKALVFVHVAATPTGYIRLYEPNTSTELYYSTSVITSNDYTPYVYVAHNKRATINAVKSCNINNSLYTAMFPLLYIDTDGLMQHFPYTYYYARNVHTTYGISTVANKTLWLSADTLRYWNLVQSDNASIAIEVTP